MAQLKLSTAYTRMFLLVDSADHVTGKTGAGPTVTISKAGGAFGAAGGTVTEVSSGWYKIALTTTDTNTLGDLAFHVTGSGCDPADFADQVSTRLVDDLATPTNITAGTITTVTNLTNAPTAGDLTATMKTSVTTAATAATPTAAAVTGNVGGNVTGSVGSIATGGIAAASFAAGAIDAAAIATDAIGAAEVSAAAVTKIQAGLSTYSGGAVASVTGNVGGNVVGSVGSVVAGVTVTTNNDKTGYALSAAGNNATADQVWDEVLAGHLTAGSTGAALNAAGSAGDPWSTALPGAYGAGTAGKIVGDNIDATISSRSTVTTAQVNAEVVDALATDTYAEPSGVPAATASLKDKIGWLALLARNKRTTTSTTDTVRNDADSGTIASSAISDDGTTFTRGEYT